MATVTLGSIKFNWKGAYNSSTAYAVDDVVSSGGNSYVCIQAHTNQAVGNATAYWNIMSAAGTNGTNGTDVGTTITTQGDLLYRDGSGLQRLAAGTAGHVLQTGGSGANPSWTAVSSDYVKLATYEINSNVTGFNITGWIDNAYKFYIVRGYYRMTSGNGYFNFRLINTAGNAVSSSNYDWASRHHYINGAAATSNDHGGLNRSGWEPSSTNSIGTGYHGQMELHLSHENLVTAEQTGCMWQSFHRESGGQVDGFIATGWLKTTDTFSGSNAGIQFDRANANTFGDGTVTVYGLK